MSRIFVYYSDTGNGDAVASYLKDKGFAVRKVIPKKPLAKSFFWKILQGGFLAGIGAKSPLNGFDPDVSAFDEVVIGSPIWNGRLACPINTVLEQTDLSEKKLTFLLYSGSGAAPQAESKIQSQFQSAAVLHLKQPLDNPAELTKLAAL
ncbi:MAG: hypothetical protein IJP98_04430 [Clostridia bacterium]|nr:hypothetical protein [Clostridia bacterium]